MSRIVGIKGACRPFSFKVFSLLETYQQQLTEVFEIIRKGLFRFREFFAMDPEFGPMCRTEASGFVAQRFASRYN